MARPPLATRCSALVLLGLVTGCAPDGEGAATWRVADRASVTSGSTSIAVLVTRLGCNSGVTGEVRSPEVDLDEREVVVTYTVEDGAGDGTCQGNDAVPVTLELPEALGDRRLVDGGCRQADPGAGCVRVRP